jgi:preprotein translocase subunit YajC
MFNPLDLLISQAWAQAAAPAAAPTGPAGLSPMLMNLLPLVLIFGVFYLLVIRPQQKKVEEQNKMIKSLQRGDRIITTGGVYGKIVRLEGDDNIIVEIADNVQIKMQRAFVQNLAAKTQPVTSADTSDADKKN